MKDGISASRADECVCSQLVRVLAQEFTRIAAASGLQEMPGLHQRAARSAPVCCFSSAPPPNTKIPLRNTPAERYEQKLLTQTNRTNKVAKAATHGPFMRWGGE